LLHFAHGIFWFCSAGDGICGGRVCGNDNGVRRSACAHCQPAAITVAHPHPAAYKRAPAACANDARDNHARDSKARTSGHPARCDRHAQSKIQLNHHSHARFSRHIAGGDSDHHGAVFLANAARHAHQTPRQHWRWGGGRQPSSNFHPSQRGSHRHTFREGFRGRRGLVRNQERRGCSVHHQPKAKRVLATCAGFARAGDRQRWQRRLGVES